MARATRAQDAALKRAPVVVLACAPVSPGKVVLLLAGDVASVEESLAAARAVVGNKEVDTLYLPGVHPRVIDAVYGVQHASHAEALGILELASVAATLGAADAAVKTSDVQIGRMHLAAGYGGKGYFTLRGAQSAVEAALEAGAQVGGPRTLDQEIIPAPHDELELAAFTRPWGIDPVAR